MIRVVFRIAVAALMLALIARRVDLGAVASALASVPPSAVVWATIASFAANFVIAFRLRVLMASQGVDASAFQTLAVNFVAYFYGLSLPVGGIGIAAFRLQRLR